MKRREAIRTGALASSIGVLSVASKSVEAFDQYDHPVEDAVEFKWNTDDRKHRVEDGPAAVIHYDKAGGLHEVCHDNAREYANHIFDQHPCWSEFNTFTGVRTNIYYHGWDMTQLSDPPTIVLWEQGWPLWNNLDAEEEIEDSHYDSLDDLRQSWCEMVDCE